MSLIVYVWDTAKGIPVSVEQARQLLGRLADQTDEVPNTKVLRFIDAVLEKFPTRASLAQSGDDDDELDRVYEYYQQIMEAEEEKE